MKERLISRNRQFVFEVIDLIEELLKSMVNSVFERQLIRSSSSVGANYDFLVPLPAFGISQIQGFKVYYFGVLRYRPFHKGGNGSHSIEELVNHQFSTKKSKINIGHDVHHVRYL